MVPTGKKDPGALVLCCSVAVPESSVAVGSVHDTVVPPVPAGMVRVMSLIDDGVMVGGVLSSETVRLN